MFLKEDQLDQMVRVVRSIQSDENLRQVFVRVLEIGSLSQQERVYRLKQALEGAGAPAELVNFLELLLSEQIAHQVYLELKK